MIGLLLASALLSSGVQAAPSPEPQVVIADMRISGVADPQTFVAAIYARYQAHPDTPPPV